jgi:hypothetical protein
MMFLRFLIQIKIYTRNEICNMYRKEFPIPANQGVNIYSVIN